MAGNVIQVLLWAVLFVSESQTFLIGHDSNPASNLPAKGDEGHFRFAAVASNTDVCSKIGTDILARRDGSAVDAAIATMACVGVVRFQSSGLGGDSFWTIYHRETRKAYTIVSRGMAPRASNSTMFVNNTDSLQEGGLSVTVPGEVMAFWKAHQLLGRLPWSDLFDDAIRLAEDGFPCESSLDEAIQSTVHSGVLNKFPQLRKLLTNPQTNSWYTTGDILRNPALAITLRKVAAGGAVEFYNGSLTDEMVKELQQAGGIIDKKDFSSYYSDVTEPLKLRLNGNLTVYSPPLPSSGVIFQYILNILSGYNMSSDDLSTNEKTILTYHRHLEAFKHAYAARSKLGSPYGEAEDFKDEMKQLLMNLTSPEYGEEIRRLIEDNSTRPWKDYNSAFDIKNDHGTSQLSVLSATGDAVSVTSTVNLFFGSKVVGTRTGIVYNDLMDDFSTPGITNGFGVLPSPSNFIKPGKRPMSSMTPSIVVDHNGLPVLTIGAAGGTMITTTSALITSLTLWLGENMKSAIDAPAIHHQLLPEEALITNNAPQWLIEGLKAKGHQVRVVGGLSSPAGILQRSEGQIFANSKLSTVDGY